MPEYRDPVAYRLQAKRWQEKAALFSCGEERAVYLMIADGYARLAQLIEKRASIDGRTGFNPSTDDGQKSAID